MAGPMSLPVAWSRLSVNAKEALFYSDVRRHLVFCSTAISTRTTRAASCQAYKNGRGNSTSKYRGRRRWQEDESAPSSREDWRDLQRNSRGSERQNSDGPSSQRQDEWKPREARAAGLKADWRGDAVYGVAPVLAAMTARRRELFKLFVQESMDMKKRKDADAIRRILAAAEELGMEVLRVGKHELNLVTGDRPHQGLVLDCSPLMWQQMDRLPTAASATEQAAAAGLGLPCWLALDEVCDPQNLGAMVRSAHMLGAAGVLACDRNCAPLSAAVSKASAGAVEVMPLHSCRQLPRTLQDAALNGWTVVGAAAGAGSVSCNAFEVRQPTVLVMGNEGYGLRTNVARCCHQMLKIDMAPRLGSPGVVDSLNVSVATGILLHRLVASAAPCRAKAPTQS